MPSVSHTPFKGPPPYTCWPASPAHSCMGDRAQWLPYCPALHALMALLTACRANIRPTVRHWSFHEAVWETNT